MSIEEGRPVRVGLIGCGTVAGYGHLPAIAQTPGLVLSSVCDINADAASRAAERFGGQAFTDPEAFAGSGLDAMVITSPVPAHLDHVRLAAARKLPVLCEKPLGMNERQIETMIESMRDAGVPLYAGFTYRFSPSAQRIRDLVRAGVIGAVRMLRLIYIWDCHGRFVDGPDGRRIESPRRMGRMIEGGPMVDCGVHQIDLARWWLDSPVIAQRAHGAWVERYAAPDHMVLHLDHACGAHTMIEISYSYCHTAAQPRREFVYELIGTDGIIRFDREARIFEIRNSTGTEALPFMTEKNFDGMYVEFDRALRSGFCGDMPTGEDGLIATRIARQATDQVISERPAPVPPGSAERSMGGQSLHTGIAGRL